MTKDFKIKIINCTEKDLNDIGFDKTYIKNAVNKHRFKTVKIHNLTCAQANILKQTALTSGTDCAVHREVITGKVELSDCILSGSISQLKTICEKLKFQPLKLSSLAEEIKNLLFEKYSPVIIRDTVFNWERPYIMGILNITPDSFSDGGEFNSIEKAENHFKQMLQEGADIIDIGGESTRPFAKKITADEEITRVIPVIRHIRSFDSSTIISIDTRNSQTAQKAIEAGADIINDISAFDWDEKMIDAVKDNDCPIILNHSKGTPEIMQNNTLYNDVVDDIYDYLQRKIDLLIEKGIDPAKIIIDPGIGFGKTTQQNFEIISRLQEFKTLGCPILVGHSRKNFLKETIGSDNKEELDTATLTVSQKAIENSANIIRVHNVKPHRILLDVLQSFS